MALCRRCHSFLLLRSTAPVLALRLGFPDEGALPESSTERRAYDLVAEGFGPGVNGPLLIAVECLGSTPVGRSAGRCDRADPGIAAVAPPDVDNEAGVATIVAIPTTAPQDDATVDTVDRLRAEVIPSVLDRTVRPGPCGRADGQLRRCRGPGQRAGCRSFIAAVIVLSFLLLTLVFRSILVPLKAALLNLLSIGAAYGVLVMVFQWGWGKS